MHANIHFSRVNVQLTTSKLVLTARTLKPFMPLLISCEARIIIFKCLENPTKPFQALWRYSKAHTNIFWHQECRTKPFKYQKDPTKPFKPLWKSCDACTTMFTRREGRKKTLQPLRTSCEPTTAELVLAFLSDGMVESVRSDKAVSTIVEIL